MFTILTILTILSMEETMHQFIGSLFHHLQGFSTIPGGAAFLNHSTVSTGGFADFDCRGKLSFEVFGRLLAVSWGAATRSCRGTWDFDRCAGRRRACV